MDAWLQPPPHRWSDPQLDLFAMDYWREIYSQLAECDLLDRVQPITARLLAQSLWQYELVTEELNRKVNVVDESTNASTGVTTRRVCPEFQAQSELVDRIRKLIRDLMLHDRAPDADRDPIEALVSRARAARTSRN